MVALTSLWLPILVSAVLVFVASSLIHMVLAYHRADYGKAPSEDAVMDALRSFNIPPGDYLLPCAESPAAARSPEMVAKRRKGPVVVMTVFPPGEMQMGPRLIQWFLFAAIVGLCAGYVASRVLPPGTPYMEVFQITSTVAFVGYALALWELTIWYNRSLGTTIRSTIDGLIYGLLTGGAFGWLWPGTQSVVGSW
ncbi:MAG: hypothetical protein HYU37_11235 [Acidobacteria bacterium]|nr:hypothetical protein [Acidobacteriota bacterium]